MHKKQMFVHNWQLDEDKNPFFIKYGYLWHFTGFSVEDRIKINDVWYVREDIQKKRSYMLGDTFSLGFDYEGMLDYALQIEISEGENSVGVLG